jgi:hypothetical protein
MSYTVSPRSSPQELSTLLVERRRAKVPSADALEIRVLWGDVCLDVIELAPPREFFVGDGSSGGTPPDFTVPGCSVARVPLVGFEGGRLVAHVPPGASAARRSNDPKAAAPTTSVTAETVLLDRESCVEVAFGAVRFSLRLGERQARCPRALVQDSDTRPLGYFALAAALSGALVASVAFFTPPLGLTEDDALERDRLYLIQQYLEASAEIEREPEHAQEGETRGGADAPQAPASGEAGKIGRRDLTTSAHRASGSEPGAEFHPAMSRAEALAEAAEFGLAGMLATGIAGTTAAWDDPGTGLVAAAGGFFGSDIGEIGGIGGLAPIGNGEGGGFRGNQIGLNSIGTCHGEECLGHFGIGGRPGVPGHIAKAPELHPGVTTVERGSLPAEIIQRIVRQSFGRFRGCYEAGLRTNPNLEGRVTARFVIARDGSVATVHSGGSDLPDPSVVACVLRAYSGLTFPSPKDGIVTVTYPLTFTPAA